MAQMKDSFGVEYYITDFKLNYDLEKPGLLKATAIIPSGDIVDSPAISVACGTTQYQAYNMCVWGKNLYIAMGSDGTIAGQIYRYTNEQFWEVVYDGEGLREVPQCLIFSYSGGWIYWGSAFSGKVFYSNTGTSYAQCGPTLSGGNKIKQLATYQYGGTNYVVAICGKKLWRSVEGTTTWTDVTPTNIYNADILSVAIFNSRVWIGTSRGGCVYYSTDNCATFTYLYLEAYFIGGQPTFLFPYGSYLYVFGNTCRISRISTSTVVTNVYNSLEWGSTNGDALCGTTFEGKPHIGLINGRIIYSTDGTGDYGTWTTFANLPSLGYGIPLTIGVYTNLYVGTNNYQVLQCTPTSHVWSVAKTTTEKNINASYIASTSYFGGGMDESNTGALYQTTSIGGPWTKVYGNPEYYITDIVVWNNYIYACTAGKGFILRSSDGDNWDIVYDSTSTNLYAIGISTGYIWASGDASGYCFRSSDGVTWAVVSGTPAVTMYCMSKDTGSAFVYVGCSDGTIRKCTDVVAWTTEVSGIGAAVRCIGRTSYSTANWAAGTANGRFYYNAGGWTYNTPESASRTIWGVTFYNGKWYACQDNGKVYNSTTPHPTFTWVYEFTIGDPTAKCIMPFGIDMYIGGYNTSSKASIYKYVNSMLTRESKPQIDNFGAIECLYVWNNYIYAGGWIDTATSTDYAIILRSSDGIRWEEVYREASVDSSIASLCAFGNYLYAGQWGGALNAKLYRSYTGKDWTLAYTFLDDTIDSLCVFGSYLYAGTSRSSNYARIYRSNDGTTWALSYVTADATKNYTYSLYAWGSYLYAGGGGTSSSKRWLVRTSTGVYGDWSDVSTGITTTYTGIASIYAFGGYIYVGCYWTAGDGRPVWRSATGAASSWSQVTGLTASYGTTICYSLYATSEKLYAILHYSEVYETTNGTTWTKIHSMSTNSTEYACCSLYDKLITAGQRIYYTPLSRMGRMIQKLKNSDYFEFYSCGNNLTEKYILKELQILNETLFTMTLQSHIIDLWRSFGYYIEGTTGWVDYSEDGIYADELAGKVVDSTCNSKFRIKYCPHIKIKIKGEWLSKPQWLYEIARNLSFAINSNSSYPTYQLMATTGQSDVMIDRMNVVVESNGDIFIMPAGSTISGTNPNYIGYFAKRITNITGYVWEATNVSANMIDYTNAIVLDGSGTGAARKNYLALPITVSYTNNLDTLDKVKEMSNIIYEPGYSGSYIGGASLATSGNSMNLWMQITNTNFRVDADVTAYHPSLVVSIDNDVIIKAAVSNTAVLDAMADTNFFKEAGFSFGGGNEAGKSTKMYRAVLREERTVSATNYYVKLLYGNTELASATLTGGGTDISTVSDMNYLVVKWYKNAGTPTIKVFMSNTTMPDPATATPKITYASTTMPHDFGIVGLHGRCGFRILGGTATYEKTTPRPFCFFNTFSVSGRSLSLWNSTSITGPVMLIRDKSITSKDEARNVAINAYQTASVSKELTIRVDPSKFMWGLTADRIWIGQWVLISGKGYYDGEYRVKTIEVTQDGMWLGLDNSKINFSDYVDAIRQQVNKVDSFG